MTTQYSLRLTSLLSLLTGISLAACASTIDPGDKSAGGGSEQGGEDGSGGTDTGGSVSGKGGGGSAGKSDVGKGGAGKADPGKGGGGSAGKSNPKDGGKSDPAKEGGAAGKADPALDAGKADPAKDGGKSDKEGGAGGNAGPVGDAGPGTKSAENSGADCKVSAGEKKTNKKLPDPFAMNDGTRISSKEQWECRRNEIKKDIEKYEIGTKPEPPTVEASVSGNKLNVKVTTSAGSITLNATVGSASGSGANCVAIGMNGNASLISGCVQVPFMHDQVVKYAMNDTQNKSDPFYKLYPDLYGKIGNYNAWSWGISRLIDGLEQVKDQLKIDTTKIGVQGCSYAGKMALFGGAFDERVALTVVQESGGGGINSWRTSQDFTSRSGKNIEKIDNTNYSWFMSSMKSLDPYSLPHDHHELIAMIAPRAVIALGNPQMEWLGDESGYKSVMAAKEVWKAMGVEDRFGFDFTGGHDHCAAPASQSSAVKAFVDKFLKGASANTNIAVKPSQSGFQLDPAGVIDWQTPTLQ